MKCLTFFHGQMSDGISVTSHVKHGTVLWLGSAGVGGRSKLISLDRKNPADVRRGKVYFCTPAIIDYVDRDEKHIRFPVLSKSFKHTADACVRINTSQSDVCVHAGWEPVAGTPEMIVGGWGCDHPDLSKRRDSTTHKWADDLVVLKSGDSVNVIISPVGGDDRSYTIKNDNGKIVMIDLSSSDQEDADDVAAWEQAQMIPVGSSMVAA